MFIIKLLCPGVVFTFQNYLCWKPFVEVHFHTYVAYVVVLHFFVSELCDSIFQGLCQWLEESLNPKNAKVDLEV
jgi:hypothetical protein